MDYFSELRQKLSHYLDSDSVQLIQEAYDLSFQRIMGKSAARVSPM